MDVDVTVLFLLLFILFILPWPEVFRLLIRTPLSLRCFLGGVVGAAALAPAWFGEYAFPGWAAYVLLGMFYLSPIWFSIGARRSLEEMKGRGARVVRWLNVTGFAVSVGLLLMFLVDLLVWRYYGPLIALAVAVVVVLVFSRLVLAWPPSRFRSVRFLPGYPAVLIAPSVFVAWAMLCLFNRWAIPWTSWEGWGFPVIFFGWRERAGSVSFGEFHFAPFVIDLLIAAVAAWVLAWGADRLPLRWVWPPSREGAGSVRFDLDRYPVAEGPSPRESHGESTSLGAEQTDGRHRQGN